MKSPKFLFATIFLLSLIACKKNDFETSPNSSDMQVEPSQSEAALEPVQEDSLTYTTKLSDNLINSSIVTSGLVLVYKKEGGTISALPVSENGKSWYYQIFNGGIDVFCVSPIRPDANISYVYLIITPEQLKSLENQQYSKAKLMGLSYNEVSALLK